MTEKNKEQYKMLGRLGICTLYVHLLVDKIYCLLFGYPTRTLWDRSPELCDSSCKSHLAASLGAATNASLQRKDTEVCNYEAIATQSNLGKTQPLFPPAA